MTVRIGFVGCLPDSPLGESVRPLIPPDCSYEILSITQATTLVSNGELTVLIVAVDSPQWREGLRMLLELHAVGVNRPLAVFGLVPRDDPAALVTAFDMRVADVAGLPLDPHEVRARLAALVRRRQVAFARAADTRKAWKIAVTDPVTGLYNRQHLDTILPATIDSARITRQPLALMMLDVDGLKPYNDRWGHGAGDILLRSLAETLQAHVRIGDTVARYGGDEIVIIMPECDAETARTLSARLVDLVADMRVARPDGSRAGVTVSVGLAMLLPDGDAAEALLTRADMALYAAKRSGRNQVAVAA